VRPHHATYCSTGEGARDDADGDVGSAATRATPKRRVIGCPPWTWCSGPAIWRIVRFRRQH